MEFLYPIEKLPKVDKKQKTLTVYWNEPCDPNPAHTVAPPPPSPPPTHYVSEMNENNFSLFGWLTKPKEQPKTQQEKEKEEQLAALFKKKIEVRQEGRILRGCQPIAKEDDYSYLDELLKNTFGDWKVN